MEKYEEKALKDIEEFGCHVLNVLGDDEGPGFSYSIGIERTSGQPELIVTGLKSELANWMVNEYNARVRTREAFQPGAFYSGFIDGFDVTFREVEEKHYADYFGWANWLYDGDQFRVLQLIYPSTQGFWPWDSEATADFKWFLPKLYAN
ncbi:MAG: DUF4262 domain-containing protein [Pseudomonadota bacterium]